jgi:hypothetical protein
MLCVIRVVGGSSFTNALLPVTHVTGLYLKTLDACLRRHDFSISDSTGFSKH